MTIEVLVANLSGNKEQIIEVSSTDGTVETPEATLRGGENKKILIWKEKRLIVREIKNG